MEVSERSWHARFFHSLESRNRSAPSVCEYWSCVLLIMPAFYIFTSPIALLVCAGEYLAKLIPKRRQKIQKSKRMLCPFGKVTFVATDKAPDLIKHGT